MSNLIEALKIFLKYEDRAYPLGCEHDTLYVYYNPSKISKEDIAVLDELGFHASFDEEHFYAFV